MDSLRALLAGSGEGITLVVWEMVVGDKLFDAAFSSSAPAEFCWFSLIAV